MGFEGDVGGGGFGGGTGGFGAESGRGLSDKEAAELAAEAAGLGIGGAYGEFAGPSVGGYTNRAERPDLAPFGGTQFTGQPGAQLPGFATTSSPQGLFGLFGQYGPFSQNNYSSWANVSPTNVARDLGAVANIGGNVVTGNLPGAALGLAAGLPGMMGRNQGAMPSPGGYGGQSYDPAADRAAMAAQASAPASPETEYAQPERAAARNLYENPALAQFQGGMPESLARWLFQNAPQQRRA